MDPATITAIGAAIGVALREANTWRQNRQTAKASIDDKLDDRITREFTRMDEQIEELRVENEARKLESERLRNRVIVLEALLNYHGIPLPDEEPIR
jgi:hypothetical protein